MTTWKGRRCPRGAFVTWLSVSSIWQTSWHKVLPEAAGGRSSKEGSAKEHWCMATESGWGHGMFPTCRPPLLTGAPQPGLCIQVPTAVLIPYAGHSPMEEGR